VNSNLAEQMDLRLTEGTRDERDKYIDKFEVLDKVKSLVLLPYNETATTDIVADYYNVNLKTIEKLVERNKDELVSDGYSVLKGNQLTDIKSVCQIKSRARSMAVFTKRSILRVGMLLRDSEVAKRVRTMLLDVEQISTTDQKIIEINKEDEMLLAIVKAKDSVEQMIALGEYRKYTERYKKKYNQFIDANGTYNFTETAKLISTIANEEGSDVKISNQALTKFLRDKKVLNKTKTKNGYSNLPNKNYEDYFNTTSLEITTKNGGFNKPVTRVKGSGVEFIYELLLKDMPQ